MNVIKFGVVFYLLLLVGCIDATAADIVLLGDGLNLNGCDQLGQGDYQGQGYASPYGGGYGSNSAYQWDKLTSEGWAQVFVWVLAAFVGAVFHFYIDVKKGILPEGGLAGLYRYLFKFHIGATVQTFIAIFVACGAWFSYNEIPAPWVTLCISAFVWGYTSDSVLNRGLTHFG